jgi:hypothetical protein
MFIRANLVSSLVRERYQSCIALCYNERREQEDTLRVGCNLALEPIMPLGMHMLGKKVQARSCVFLSLIVTLSNATSEAVL